MTPALNTPPPLIGEHNGRLAVRSAPSRRSEAVAGRLVLTPETVLNEFNAHVELRLKLA
jgi:hypothetical protein